MWLSSFRMQSSIIIEFILLFPVVSIWDRPAILYLMLLHIEFILLFSVVSKKLETCVYDNCENIQI